MELNVSKCFLIPAHLGQAGKVVVIVVNELFLVSLNIDIKHKYKS